MLKFMIFKETEKNNYFIIIVDLILTKIWNICVFWVKYNIRKWNWLQEIEWDIWSIII